MDPRNFNYFRDGTLRMDYMYYKGGAEKLYPEPDEGDKEPVDVQELTKLLFEAVDAGDSDGAFALLKRGADATHARSHDGITPLFVAVQNGNRDLAAILIDSSFANTNHAIKDGTTPLWCAAQAGRADLVDLLLSRSARVDLAKASTGETPLYAAAARSKVEVVELLLKHLAEANQVTTTDGTSPLWKAAELGHVDVATVLLDRGADVHLAAKGTGATPLYIAVRGGHTDMVRLLIDRGADPNQGRTDTGATPWGIAHDNKELTGVMLEAMAARTRREDRKAFLEQKTDPTVQDGSTDDAAGAAGAAGVSRHEGPPTVFVFAGSGEEGHTDGSALKARFRFPSCVTAGPDGDVFVVDFHCVRRITPQGHVSTIAGDGTDGDADGVGEDAQVSSARALTHDGKETLYVGEADRIRRIQPEGDKWRVSTVCQESDMNIIGIAMYGTEHLVATDAANHRVVCVTLADGTISVLAGCGKGYRDGPAAFARFHSPEGLVVAPSGDIFVCDGGEEGPGARVRRIAAADSTVTTLAGGGEQRLLDGPGVSARFRNPEAIAIDGAGTILVGSTWNERLRLIAATDDHTVATAKVTIGPGVRQDSPEEAPYTIGGCIVDFACGVVFADSHNHRILRIDGLGLVPPPAMPIAAIPRSIDAKLEHGFGAVGCTVTTIIGSGGQGYADGPAETAKFMSAAAVAVGPDGTRYVADYDGHRIRRIAPDGSVSTVAGSGEAGSDDGLNEAATLDSPSWIAHDGRSIIVVVATGLRRVTPEGDGRWRVSTIGGAAAEEVQSPSGVAVDSVGRIIVADNRRNQVLGVAADGSTVDVIAGDGTRGLLDGPAASAQFSELRAVAVGPTGDIYVADARRVRRCANGVVTTIAGSDDNDDVDVESDDWVADMDVEDAIVDGPGAVARFHDIEAIAVDGNGTVIVADGEDDRIQSSCVRLIAPSDEHTVTTIAGGVACDFTATGIAIDHDGGLVVADWNGRIHHITELGLVPLGPS